MAQNILEIKDKLHLVPLSNGYRIYDFKCEIEEYTNFLHFSALDLQEMNISKTHLLINKQNADIIAYISLIADMIKLNKTEKTESDMDMVPFESFPALKIGKLAVDQEYHKQYSGIGTLMIRLVKGFANDLNHSGVACKFITINADKKNNPTIVDFYLKNGFKYNESYNKKLDQVSMRLDLYHYMRKET